MMSLKQQIARLRAFTTCQVSDVLAMHGSRYGGSLPRLLPLSPATIPDMSPGRWNICGPAVTVRFAGAGGAPGRKLPQHFVESLGPGDVMVIEVPETKFQKIAGSWDSKMSARARFIGAEGVVSNASLRELDECEGFPIFCQGRAVLAADAWLRPCRIGEEVTLCTLKIKPGDIILGDVNGIVCIKRSELHKTLIACEHWTKMNELVMTAIRNGSSIPEAQAEALRLMPRPPPQLAQIEGEVAVQEKERWRR